MNAATGAINNFRDNNNSASSLLWEEIRQKTLYRGTGVNIISDNAMADIYYIKM